MRKWGHTTIVLGLRHLGRSGGRGDRGDEVGWRHCGWIELN